MFSAFCYKRVHAAQLGILPLLLLAHPHFRQWTKRRAKRKRRRKGKKRRQVLKNSRNSSPRVRWHIRRAACSR
jgi:acyl-CoA hydrolase